MNLKNKKSYVELRSENPLEAMTLLNASLREYSPRAAGLMPNDDRMITLERAEIPNFMRGILADEYAHNREKWAVTKLLSEWMLGNVSDEATA